MSAYHNVSISSITENAEIILSSNMPQSRRFIYLMGSVYFHAVDMCWQNVYYLRYLKYLPLHDVLFTSIQLSNCIE